MCMAQLSVQTNADITAPGLSTRTLFDQIKLTLGAAQQLQAEPSLRPDGLLGSSFAYVLNGDVLLTGNIGFGTSPLAHAALLSLTIKAAANLET